MPAQEGGEPWDGDNPRLAVDPAWHDFVALWAACRGEHGIAHWPDAGGVNDQACWLVDGFRILSGFTAEWDEAKRAAKG